MRTRRASLRLLSAALGALALAAAGAFLAVSASAATFSRGDVFVLGISGYPDRSGILWYRPDGTKAGRLPLECCSPGGEIRFDPAGRLYALRGTYQGSIDWFDSQGGALGTFVQLPKGRIRSFLFDPGGNVLAATDDAGSTDVTKLDPSGNGVASYDLAPLDCPQTAPSGFATCPAIQEIALAPNGCTLFYDYQNAIKRYDVCTRAQLADFADLGFSSGAEDILPLADGTLLVARSQDIARYNTAGTGTLRLFDAPGEEWTSLALDPDGSSFWAADQDTGAEARVHRFELATGAVLGGIVPAPEQGTTDTVFAYTVGVLPVAPSAPGQPPPPPAPPPGPQGPDVDGDGIADASDACPTTRARYDADRDGCSGPFKQIEARLEKSFEIRTGGFRVNSLRLEDLSGATLVRVRCLRGCSVEERLRVKPKAHVVRSRQLTGKTLGPGAVVEIRATKAGWIGYVARVSIVRRGRDLDVRVSERCLPALGPARPVSCARVDRGS